MNPILNPNISRQLGAERKKALRRVRSTQVKGIGLQASLKRSDEGRGNRFEGNWSDGHVDSDRLTGYALPRLARADGYRQEESSLPRFELSVTDFGFLVVQSRICVLVV
jgi:hypothetical protein